MNSGLAKEADAGVVFTYADPSHTFLQKMVIRAIETVTGQPRLKRLYEDYQNENRPHSEFIGAALEKLQIDVVYDPGRLEMVPREGPLVVVANHPFGVVDGIMICWLTRKIRSDVKILTNAVLCQAPELADLVLPIDFSGTQDALSTNLRSRKEARDHLKTGGTLVVFPGGTVSNTEHIFRKGQAVDPEWQPFTSHLIRASKATVVPMFFEGQNSVFFQTASHIHPVFRLGLLFNEVRRLVGRSLRVRIGMPLAFEELAHIESRTLLADHLRTVTYSLEPIVLGSVNRTSSLPG